MFVTGVGSLVNVIVVPFTTVVGLLVVTLVVDVIRIGVCSAKVCVSVDHS